MSVYLALVSIDAANNAAAASPSLSRTVSTRISLFRFEIACSYAFVALSVALVALAALLLLAHLPCSARSDRNS